MPSYSFSDAGKDQAYSLAKAKAIPIVGDPWSQRSGVSGGKALATSYGVGDSVKTYSSAAIEAAKRGIDQKGTPVTDAEMYVWHTLGYRPQTTAEDVDDWSTFTEGAKGVTESERYLMGDNWSVGGIAMNKANYDNFWRLYNGVLKNGGTKGEAFRYAANDFNSRRLMGQALITIVAGAAFLGAGSVIGAGSSLPAAQAVATSSRAGGTALGASGQGIKTFLTGKKMLDASGQGYVKGGVLPTLKRQALHSAAFATAGQLSYGFISKFSNEWVPYYGKYKTIRTNE